MIKYPSCTAAKKAIVQMKTPLYFKSTIDSVNGKINNTIPVTLFIKVCLAASFFLNDISRNDIDNFYDCNHTNPYTKPYRNYQNRKQFYHTATTNVISAKVSSLEPNSLAVLVFLATVPSIISVNPATKYKI